MAPVTDTRVAEVALSHEGLASQPGPLSIAGSGPQATHPTRSQWILACTPPRERRRCETLWSHLSGSHSFNPSWPGSLDDAQGDAVAGLLDELRDWLDASEMSYSEGRSAAKELGERLKELVGLGLFVGVRQRHLMLAGGASEPTRWRSFDIQFQRVTEAELADENGTPYAASAT